MIVFPSGIVSELVLGSRSGGTLGPAGLSALVISGDAALRGRLRSLVVSRGIPCRAPVTVADAWRDAGVETDCRLVFVDVARPLGGRAKETRGVAESLALRPGVLLAVCGPAAGPGGPHSRAALEERWARGIGAFVYLPGVGRDDGISMLIDEAWRICRFTSRGERPENCRRSNHEVCLNVVGGRPLHRPGPAGTQRGQEAGPDESATEHPPPRPRHR